LTELETLAPEYLIETYKVLTMIEDNLARVIVKVLPPHFEDSGVQYCPESKLQVVISSLDLKFKPDWSVCVFIVERMDVIVFNTRFGPYVSVK